MEKQKFEELLESITSDLIEYMKGENLTPENFDWYMNRMNVKVRTNMLLLGEKLLTAEQVYKLMSIPEDVMLKITGLKNNE